LALELWIEKYRPKKLDDVVDQEEVVEALKGFVSRGSIPHLLFAGPAGTGKTTTAIAVAHELFGEGEAFRRNYLELNASDERGIDTIRTKVKDFARAMSFGDAPFKIIHLDEADSMTADAQHALRRVMELYSDNVRFILACNYSSKIIEPIQSRTAVFRFNPLPDEAIKERLRFIAEREEVKYEEEGLDAIVYVAEGDLRRAINLLQTASAFGGAVDATLVYKVAGIASPQEVRDMIQLALKGDFMKARATLRDLMIAYGMSAEDIVRQLHREIMALPNLSDVVKAELAYHIGEADFRLTEGSHGDIQLSALLAKLAAVGGRS